VVVVEKMLQEHQLHLEDQVEEELGKDLHKLEELLIKYLLCQHLYNHLVLEIQEEQDFHQVEKAEAEAEQEQLEGMEDQLEAEQVELEKM
jgi:hypothetical protein